MKLYLSGNFPQLVSSDKEKRFKEELHEKGFPYNRLVTFFYPKHCHTVINILKEDWHRKYKDRLIEVAKLTEKEAEEALQAAMGEYDYSKSPSDWADEEMSYWTE